MPMSLIKRYRTINVIHGPNLNLLGIREPDIYGTDSLKTINRKIRRHARAKGFRAVCSQSNHEGRIIDYIHAASSRSVGLIINPAAYTHYSIAIRDAIAATSLPAVEVHLSDITRREPFRRKSIIADVCIGQISGIGWKGYLKAVDLLVERISS